jgi:HK97 gp10 family phage protein
VSQSNFTYQSNFPKVKYALTEIEKACFKEIGRLVRKDAKGRINSRTGNLKKNINFQVRRKDKSVRIGVKRKAFYGIFLEFGTSKISAKPFITPAARENALQIRMIAAKYFKEIEKEILAINLGGTDDGEGDDS